MRDIELERMEDLRRHVPSRSHRSRTCTLGRRVCKVGEAEIREFNPTLVIDEDVVLSKRLDIRMFVMISYTYRV